MTNTLTQDVAQVLADKNNEFFSMTTVSIVRRLSERLELSADGDGIDSRDERIKVLEARVKELEAQPSARAKYVLSRTLPSKYPTPADVADADEHEQLMKERRR